MCKTWVLAFCGLTSSVSQKNNFQINHGKITAESHGTCNLVESHRGFSSLMPVFVKTDMPLYGPSSHCYECQGYGRSHTQMRLHRRG